MLPVETEPVVSVPNGAKSARVSLERELEWLTEKFRKVVIVFDQDEAGEIAARECEEMLRAYSNLEVAKVSNLSLKDPSAMLQAGQCPALIAAIRTAK